MPLFRYEVIDKTGKALMGVTDAASESDARLRLIAKGFTVNNVVAASNPKPQNPNATQQIAAATAQTSTMPTSGVSAPPKEMMVFFRSLQSYLHAGMTVFQALTEIAAHTPNTGMRRISERMASRIQLGDTLNNAMTEFPKAFPPHVVGVVAAGELGGFLPIIVGDIALDYELAQRASARWARIVCQIGWINAIGTLILAPFLAFFIPALVKSGNEGIRIGIMQYLSFTSIYIVLPITVLVVGYYVLAHMIRQPKMRPWAHKTVLRLPIYSRASKMRSLAGFTRILWRLQAAGVLPVQAWDAASRASENVVIASRLLEQSPRLRSGAKFSDVMASAGEFTGQEQRLIAVGEQSGQTVDVLERMAAYYEDAAMTAAGRTKWVMIEIVTLVNLLALGVAAIAMEAMPLQSVMKDLGI